MTRTTRHHLPRPLTAMLLATGLLLAGCTGDGGDPQAQESELPLPASVTASPSDSAEPTPTPSATGPAKPERPAAMDKKNADGAAAAAEYFLELYDYTLKSGDTDALDEMSHRACGFCGETISEAESIIENDETYKGGGLDGNLVRTLERDRVTGIFPLDFDVTQATAVIEDRNGEEVWSQGQKVTEARIEMGLRQGEWVVVEIANRPS